MTDFMSHVKSPHCVQTLVPPCSGGQGLPRSTLALSLFKKKTHMQVLLNTDTHVDGRKGMAEHLETVVKEALHRFGDHVTRVEAHVTDAVSHAKPNPDDIVCTLEARLSKFEPVVVKDHAPNAHQAIQGAVAKLKRAVATSIEKHDTRRNPAPELPSDGDEA